VTIVRTHLRYQLIYAAATNFWTMGLIVGRDVDVGTSSPDPNSEPELDWMLLRQDLANSNGAAINTTREFDVDLRAKRRMDELGQRYIVKWHNGTAASNGVAMYARVLFALP